MKEEQDVIEAVRSLCENHSNGCQCLLCRSVFALDAARARDESAAKDITSHIEFDRRWEARVREIVMAWAHEIAPIREEMFREIALYEIGQSYGVLRATIEELEEKILTITGGLHNAIDRVEKKLAALPNYESALRDIRSALGLSEHDDHEMVIETIRKIRSERGSAGSTTASAFGAGGSASGVESRIVYAAGGGTGDGKSEGLPMSVGGALKSLRPARPAPSSGEEAESPGEECSPSALIACAQAWSFHEPGEEPNTLAEWVEHARRRHSNKAFEAAARLDERDEIDDYLVERWPPIMGAQKLLDELRTWMCAKNRDRALHSAPKAEEKDQT